MGDIKAKVFKMNFIRKFLCTLLLALGSLGEDSFTEDEIVYTGIFTQLSHHNSSKESNGFEICTEEDFLKKRNAVEEDMEVDIRQWLDKQLSRCLLDRITLGKNGSTDQLENLGFCSESFMDIAFEAFDAASRLLAHDDCHEDIKARVEVEKKRTWFCTGKIIENLKSQALRIFLMMNKHSEFTMLNACLFSRLTSYKFLEIQDSCPVDSMKEAAESFEWFLSYDSQYMDHNSGVRRCYDQLKNQLSMEKEAGRSCLKESMKSLISKMYMAASLTMDNDIESPHEEAVRMCFLDLLDSSGDVIYFPDSCHLGSLIPANKLMAILRQEPARFLLTVRNGYCLEDIQTNFGREDIWGRDCSGDAVREIKEELLKVADDLKVNKESLTKCFLNLMSVNGISLDVPDSCSMNDYSVVEYSMEELLQNAKYYIDYDAKECFRQFLDLIKREDALPRPISGHALDLLKKDLTGYVNRYDSDFAEDFGRCFIDKLSINGLSLMQDSSCNLTIMKKVQRVLAKQEIVPGDVYLEVLFKIKLHPDLNEIICTSMSRYKIFNKISEVNEEMFGVISDGVISDVEMRKCLKSKIGFDAQIDYSLFSDCNYDEIIKVNSLLQKIVSDYWDPPMRNCFDVFQSNYGNSYLYFARNFG